MTNALWTSLLAVELVSLSILTLGVWCYGRLVTNHHYFLATLRYGNAAKYERPLHGVLLLTYVVLTLVLTLVSAAAASWMSPALS